MVLDWMLLLWLVGCLVGCQDFAIHIPKLPARVIMGYTNPKLPARVIMGYTHPKVARKGDNGL